MCSVNLAHPFQELQEVSLESPSRFLPKSHG
jgi:hypothetical protein